MKRAVAVLLAAAIVAVPRPASAPLPVVGAAVLKGVVECVGLAVVVGAGYIICRCSSHYYLIRVQEEETETPFYLASMASAATVAKNPGWKRCEGPFADRREPDMRALINNTNPWSPVYPCGPLGTIPPASVPVKVTLQQSTDGGASWTAVASATVDSEDNWSLGVLPATGTNGMSQAECLAFQGCDAVAVSTNAARCVLFRAEGGQP